MSKFKRHLSWLLLAISIIALGNVMLRPPPFRGSLDADAPDIAYPDALIRSYSLSKFPVELLRIPFARDVLTEDFVSYYEENDNRLALYGTVRRIAFEHKLDLPERLMESVLDEPAELALWRDGTGRLKDFVIVLTRNTLARIIQTILPAAAKATDLQLSSVGQLEGTDVEMLLLEYGLQHRLLLLSKGDKVIVLSNPRMLLAAQKDDTNWAQPEEAVKIIKELLDGEKPATPFARNFLLDKPLEGKKHEVLLSTRAFTFGYEDFLPALAAISLSFDEQGVWQSAALLDGDALPEDGLRSLWAALPYGPGFCAALPIDWRQITPMVEELDSRLEEHIDTERFITRFAGPAAACWYENSRLYTPLFVARLKDEAGESLVQEFFNFAALSTRADPDSIQTEAEKGHALWQGKIASRFGSTDEDGERSLKPALAVEGNLVFFSPDAALVKSARDVAAKRYPALADNFPAGNAPNAFIDPASLASLLRKEIFTSLPRNEEALFRNAADAYLLPRLDAFGRFPPQRVITQPQKKTPEGFAWRVQEWKESKSLH